MVDVTKAPFNAMGDGETDDTAALCAAMRFAGDNYERMGTTCSRRHNRNWVIYLPEGEYLVSDTVCQGWPAQAFKLIRGYGEVQGVEVESPQQETALYAADHIDT